MHFEQTEESRMLAASLDRFVAQRYGFADRDVIARSPDGFSPVRWSELAELGVMAALFPEEVGGLGGQGADVMSVFESLGRGLTVEPLLGALMVGRAIAQGGDAQQRSRIVELIEGRSIVALAHEEPGSHYEPNFVTCRVAPEGDGWVLDGLKSGVLNGEKSQWLLVSARHHAGVHDADGISLFLMPSATHGLTWRGYGLIDGGRAADLRLDSVCLPHSALVGNVGSGARLLEHAIGWGVLALCSEALGVMEIARRDTLEYLRTRRQFGKPIGTFQALQHRMSDLLLEIEQARSAVINAVAAIDADRATRQRALAAAKFTIGRVGTLVSEECVQMHGGIGMTWELPVSHYAKRLVMIDHQLGDEDHHLARYMELTNLGAEVGSVVPHLADTISP